MSSTALPAETDVRPGDGALRILGLSGSLRAESFNTQALRAAAALAGPEVRLELWTDLATIPPFSEDDEAEPTEAVHRLRAAITEADALLISTPEYNGSIPGQLKNALDWASRPYGESVLTGKPVAVLGASPSQYGAAWAQGDLRKVLRASGASPIDRELCVAHADTAFGPDGLPKEAELRTGLVEMVSELAAHTRTVLNTV
ncbi:NADPH-dependent FMN reductase [Streptomyces sp. URMC 123]|uniref:NADPH-dependent FMN reductase n=1 Tax=Streptomyces sp. URMC 123 TaxID=3423403 RepID=UPI003F1D8176